MRDSLDPRLRLRHLRTFLAVAREQSLQAAAVALSVSQPAVSKTLSDLEDILAARLFERGRRGATLTPEGQRFLPRADDAMRALRHALGSTEPHDRAPAVLRLGSLPTLAPALLPDVLTDFQRERPHVAVRVITSTNTGLLAGLRAGDVEMVIGRLTDPGQMAGLTFEFLYVEPLVIVVREGHPLTPNASRPSFAAEPADLNAYPMVLPTPGTVIRQAADSFMVNHGMVAPSPLIETLSISLGRRLILSSDAVWIVPAGAVSDDLDRGLLCRLPFEMAGTEEPIGLTLRSGEPVDDNAARLIEILRLHASKRGAA